MPGNRKVTSTRSWHQSISSTPNDNHSLKIFPSPELGMDELNSQICALRAELRDGRLLQARQRQELNQKTARVDNLTRKCKELRQERQGLKADLGYERGNASAIQKRLNVAVKNHAEAQDKCARTMVECERLRILNEQLSLLNGRFNASKTELEANFEEKIAEIECAFQDKVKETKSAFMRELEETRENLASERIEETKALKKELDSRDARIKKLEHDLIRQCEINAMFTVDYERDTHVRVTNRLSILASEAVGSTHSGVSLHSTASYSSSSRHPLTQLETNNVTVRKRPRVASWRSDKGNQSHSEGDDSSASKGIAAPERNGQGRAQKRTKMGYPSGALVGREQPLPCSYSSFSSNSNPSGHR